MARKNGVFAVVVLAAVLSLGPICDGSATAEDACTNLCECLYFFPAEQEACTSECLLDVAPGLSQDCLDCVAGSDCFDLESGIACTEECSIDRYDQLIGDNQ